MGRMCNSEKRSRGKQKYFKSPKLSLLEMLLAGSEKLEGEEMVEYFQAQGTLPRAVARGKYSCNQQEAEPERERKKCERGKVEKSGGEKM